VISPKVGDAAVISHRGHYFDGYRVEVVAVNGTYVTVAVKEIGREISVRDHQLRPAS